MHRVWLVMAFMVGMATVAGIGEYRTHYCVMPGSSGHECSANAICSDDGCVSGPRYSARYVVRED